MSKKVKEQSSLNQIKTSTNVLFNIIFIWWVCTFIIIFYKTRKYNNEKTEFM